MFRTLRSVTRFGPITMSRTERRLARCADVGDLRRMAQKRLPGGVFDYIDGAAEDELAIAENAATWRRVRFEPRVLRVDRSPATLDLLQGAVDAVGDDLEVLVDGGVRRGVGFVLDQLIAGAERTMALLGATTFDDLTPDLIHR